MIELRWVERKKHFLGGRASLSRVNMVIMRHASYDEVLQIVDVTEDSNGLVVLVASNQRSGKK